MAGFEVYDVEGLTLSLKSYYVDNVHNQKTVAYPGCPDLADVTRRLGARAVEMNDPSSGVRAVRIQEGERFGALVTHGYEVQGEYGNQHECCMSGDEVAASTLRPTLTRSDADRALETCRGMLIRRSGTR